MALEALIETKRPADENIRRPFAERSETGRLSPPGNPDQLK